MIELQNRQCSFFLCCEYRYRISFQIMHTTVAILIGLMQYFWPKVIYQSETEVELTCISNVIFYSKLTLVITRRNATTI